MSKNTIQVKIDNRVARLVSRYNYDKLIRYWSYAVSSYVYMSKPWYRNCKICHRHKSADSWHREANHPYIPVWDGKIKLLKRDSLPAGLFWATKDEIEKKEHIKFEVYSERRAIWPTKEKHWIRSEDKYEFQNECADKVAYSIREGNGGGLILNATGSGKTRIFAMIASRLDCDLLFIVDQLDLLEQARKEVSKHLGEKVGKVGESKFKLERVTVATIQTLHLHRRDPKFLKWFKHVDVVCIDEIHSMLNRSNFDVVHIAKPLATIGLTATLGISQKPVRLRAYALTGPVLYTYPIQQGMKDKVLSKGIGISFQYENSIDNIKGYTANEAYEEKIVSNSERNWLIANIISRANKLGKYTICLVERIKHLEKLSRRLDQAKVPHKVVSGTFKGKHTDVLTRLKHKDKFEAGKVRVILANKVFKKGIDVHRVDCIINATGRKSKNDAIQIFGRGVRTHEDKSGLVYIDITDSSDTSNWFTKAGKSRIRALKQIGITIKKYKCDDCEDIDIDCIKDLFQKADKWLKQEINK